MQHSRCEVVPFGNLEQTSLDAGGKLGALSIRTILLAGLPAMFGSIEAGCGANLTGLTLNPLGGQRTSPIKSGTMEINGQLSNWGFGFVRKNMEMVREYGDT